MGMHLEFSNGKSDWKLLAAAGLSIGLLGPTIYAQTSAPASQAPAVQATTPGNAAPYVIRTGTRLVYVDVSVRNKQGQPVQGLTKDSFSLLEGGGPQTVRYFEEHSKSRPAGPAPPMPKLPPGTFTDYQPVTPNETLNILLLDSLNTPAADQSYVHLQLEEYIKKAAPGTRIAIFGLSNQLIMLQGFSSDPQILKDAINHKTIPRYSTLLNDPSGSGVDPIATSDVVSDAATPPPAINQTVTSSAANYQQFAAQNAEAQLQLRLQYTLDSFNALAHYLAAFQGHKNLIWFSGSFPLNILPSPGLQNPFAIANVNENEYRETVNLLTKAQVAVFPVDARGLRAPSAYNAAASGRRYSSNPSAFTADVNQFVSDQTAEHSTMDLMAESTGGLAFYNTNALSTAVSQAIDAGSSYYTLAYAPTNTKQDGAYRKIQVNLTTSAASRGLTLSFRQGYYAEDAAAIKKSAEAANLTPVAGLESRAVANAERAAMSRGAPPPQDLLFTVRVLPASTALETEMAPGNAAGLAKPSKGPFHRFDIDCVTLPKNVTLTLTDDGRRTGKLEFIVYVFDVAGTLLNADGKVVDLNLTPASYKNFERGVIEAHLEISVPIKVETFLRVGVRDVPSNHFGAVEIPVASVSRLPVAVYPPGSVGAASAPATAAPSPAPKQ